MSGGSFNAPEDIVHFWFDELQPSQWYKGDAALDSLIRRRFGAACHALLGEVSLAGHAWMADAHSALALILLTDQFPRHVWRGSNAAYALDPLAREVTASMLDLGFDLSLGEAQRSFVYTPLMHSEDLEDQALCVALCEERLGPEDSTTRHARLHFDVIAKFGRFPHRNEALMRASTPEEAAFLAGGGYAPGAKRPAKSSDG